MRALIVTNMYPTPARPALGSFVRDQVEALRRIPEVELELLGFAPGGLGAYVGAARDALRRYRAERFDIVHAHFGLTLAGAPGARTCTLVTLHGTDLSHPRSRPITLAALRLLDLVATVSEPLATRVPKSAFGGAAGGAARGGRREAVSLDFRAPRHGPRLGLDPDRPVSAVPSGSAPAREAHRPRARGRRRRPDC